MQKVKGFLLSLLLFIVFSVLGVAVSIGSGFLVVFLNDGGAFSSWKLLDSQYKFDTIVDANSYTVWATNTDGKLFYYKDVNKFYCDELDCNLWIETKDVSEDARSGGEYPVTRDTSCQFDNLMFLRKPPGIIKECVHSRYVGPEFGTVTYYALLNNGAVWKWEHHGDRLLYTAMFLCLIPTGFFLGIYGLKVFMARRKKNEDQ